MLRQPGVQADKSFDFLTIFVDTMFIPSEICDLKFLV